MQIRVRAITAADGPALLPLRGIAGLPTEMAETTALARSGGPTEGGVLLERGGAIVGLAAWAPSGEIFGARILGLALLPDARGAGLDLALARGLVAALPGEGYRRADASPPPAWVSALTAAGFRADVEQLVFHTPALPFAEGFAAALHAHDFARAGLFLDPDCVYELPGKNLIGTASILSAYQGAAELAAARMDEIIHEVRVESIGGDRFRARFSDRVRALGHAHTYSYDQVLTVPAGAGITRVVLRERPGERARLYAFYRRAGIG